MKIKYLNLSEVEKVTNLLIILFVGLMNSNNYSQTLHKSNYHIYLLRHKHFQYIYFECLICANTFRDIFAYCYDFLVK